MRAAERMNGPAARPAPRGAGMGAGAAGSLCVPYVPFDHAVCGSPESEAMRFWRVFFLASSMA